MRINNYEKISYYQMILCANLFFDRFFLCRVKSSSNNLLSLCRHLFNFKIGSAQIHITMLKPPLQNSSLQMQRRNTIVYVSIVISLKMN